MIRLQPLYRIAAILFVACAAFLAMPVSDAQAKCKCNPCYCQIPGNVNSHTDGQFTAHENWMRNQFWRQELEPALRKMTRQLTKASQSAVHSYSTIIDNDTTNMIKTTREEVKGQIENENRFSPGQCTLASAKKGAASTTEMNDQFGNILFDSQIARLTNASGSAGATPKDNATGHQINMCKYNYPSEKTKNMCQTAAPDTMQDCHLNINCVLRSKNISFDPNSQQLSPQGQAVGDFMTTLFSPEVSPPMGREELAQANKRNIYMEKRGLITKRALAIHCFSRVIKQYGSGSPEGAEIMANIKAETGVPPEVAASRVGTNPSMVTHREINAKDMFQRIQNFSEKGERDTSVRRMMSENMATNLELQRQIMDSSICQEMMLSALSDIEASRAARENTAREDQKGANK